MDIQTAIIALLSVALGGYITYLTQIIIAKKNREKEAETVLVSLKAEIYVIIKLIEFRGYIEKLQDSLNSNAYPKEIDSQKNEPPFPPLIVDTGDTYNLAFKNNISKIGLLSSNDAAQIIIFYNLLESIALDVKKDSFFNENIMTYEAVAEVLKLLEEAVKIGKEIIKDFPPQMATVQLT